MEENRKLDTTDLKEVAGGHREPAAMRCPKCGEWNTAGWYTPPGPNDEKINVLFTFRCSNCGNEYSGSFVLPG